MYKTIREWFERTDTPFSKSSQLSRAIATCQGAPFFGRKEHIIASFLSMVWRGARHCSPRLSQSIDCAIRKEMAGIKNELVTQVITDLHDAIDGLKSLPRRTRSIEIIASFLADSKNRGVVQAIATFDPEIDLPEPVVEELLRLSEQSPISLSDETCIQLFGDLNEARI